MGARSVKTDARSVQSKQKKRGVLSKMFGKRSKKDKPQDLSESEAIEWVKNKTPRTSNTSDHSYNNNQHTHPNGILKKEVSTNSSRSTRGTKTSWFCRSSHFRSMCDSAFKSIDADGSGSVDATELYSGLLLIHLKLGMYAGPAACRPLSRERCQDVFTKMDEDGSGALDKEEFREVMMVLFGNVFLRVMVQWSMTLAIVPIVAQYLLDGICLLVRGISHLITTLDEHSSLANMVEVKVEETVAWTAEKSPTVVITLYHKVAELLELVPDSVWSAIPLTLISTVLGIVVVPWCIFQVDDYFQRIADRKSIKSKTG